MKFLVTGSSGLVGSQVVKDLVQQNHTVYSCYHDEKPLDGIPISLDLTDENKIIQTLEEIKPDRIIHLAAMTSVDLCETEQKLATQINTKATEILANQAAKQNAFFLYVSTDYVFDGKNNPYDELDQTNPLNYYGQTKLESEKLILSINEYLIIRTAWVNDVEKNSSSFIMQVINSLKNNEVFSVPFDQYGSPTITSNLSEIIFELIQKNQKGIFHVTGLTYIDRYNFAIKIAEVFLLNRKLIKKISTAELNQKIKRPLEVNLDLKKLKSIITTKIFSLDVQLDLMKKTSKF